MRANITYIAVAAAFALPVYAQSNTPAMPRGAQSPAAGAPARAESPPQDTAAGSSMTFRSLDTNKDGHVSRDEAKNSSELNRRFSELDKDGDGKLSAQELSGLDGKDMGGARSGSSSAPMGRDANAGSTRSDASRPAPSQTKQGY